MAIGKFGRVTWTVAALALLAAILVPNVFGPANGTAPFVMTNMHADPRLSVLTYNVEGLPWPLRFGRKAAFDKIEARLAALRTIGQQPHIVALQEAFSYDAKRIGLRSGYRYIATGPAADLAGDSAALPADIAFQSAGRFVDGERSGKLLDSGLQILSDYPILSVRRMAFPAYACAGYDCMANKGVLLAMIAVPGMAEPIAVVNVHLNSRSASGVAEPRSFYAYKRQIDAIDAFLAHAVRPGTAVIVAGDFNVGPRANRENYLVAHFRRWTADPAHGLVTDALRTCFSQEAPCGPGLPADAANSLQLARDWQLSVPGARYALSVRSLGVPFGHERDGAMYSDHIGYTAYYDIARQRADAAAANDGVRPAGYRSPGRL